MTMNEFLQEEFEITTVCDMCDGTRYVEIEIEPDNFITKKCPYHEVDLTQELD